MPYEWQPLWVELEDPHANAAYLARIRAMVMASINWLADHPTATPTWRERRPEPLIRQAGLPANANVVFVGAWEDFFTPTNSHARHWFRAMSDACGKGDLSPTIHMMSKAVGCGMAFKKLGWDKFNLEMHAGGEAIH